VISRYQVWAIVRSMTARLSLIRGKTGAHRAHRAPLQRKRSWSAKYVIALARGERREARAPIRRASRKRPPEGQAQAVSTVFCATPCRTTRAPGNCVARPDTR
jgi:hypothetical protein